MDGLKGRLDVLAGSQGDCTEEEEAEAAEADCSGVSIAWNIE